jgi:hypothetical protein
LIWLIYTIFKFVAGNFTWSIELFQIIEEQSKTDEDLQENLKVADECGRKGINSNGFESLIEDDKWFLARTCLWFTCKLDVNWTWIKDRNVGN